MLSDNISLRRPSPPTKAPDVLLNNDDKSRTRRDHEIIIMATTTDETNKGRHKKILRVPQGGGEGDDDDQREECPPSHTAQLLLDENGYEYRSAAPTTADHHAPVTAGGGEEEDVHPSIEFLTDHHRLDQYDERHWYEDDQEELVRGCPARSSSNNVALEMLLFGESEEEGNDQEEEEEEEFHLQMAKEYFDRGMDYWTDSDMDNAMREFSQSLEIREDISGGRKDPETAKCYLWVGTIHFLKEDWEQALDDFSRCFRIQYELSMIHHEDHGGDDNDACHVVRNWINKSLDAKGGMKKSTSTQQQQQQQAVKKWYWEQFMDAIEQEQSGDSFMEKEDYDLAIESYKRALRLEYGRRDLSPSNPERFLADCGDLHYKLARCYHLQTTKRNWDSAWTEYRQALLIYTSDPKFVGSRHRRGYAARTKEQMVELALEMGYPYFESEDYVQSIPTAIRHEQNGDWLLLHGDDDDNYLDAAIQEYEAALEIETGSIIGNAQAACARLYYKLGKASFERSSRKKAHSSNKFFQHGPPVSRRMYDEEQPFSDHWIKNDESALNQTFTQTSQDDTAPPPDLLGGGEEEHLVVSFFKENTEEDHNAYPAESTTRRTIDEGILADHGILGGAGGMTVCSSPSSLISSFSVHCHEDPGNEDVSIISARTAMEDQARDQLLLPLSSRSMMMMMMTEERMMLEMILQDHCGDSSSTTRSYTPNDNDDDDEGVEIIVFEKQEDEERDDNDDQQPPTTSRSTTICWQAYSEEENADDVHPILTEASTEAVIEAKTTTTTTATTTHQEEPSSSLLEFAFATTRTVSSSSSSSSPPPPPPPPSKENHQLQQQQQELEQCSNHTSSDGRAGGVTKTISQSSTRSTSRVERRRRRRRQRRRRKQQQEEEEDHRGTTTRTSLQHKGGRAGRPSRKKKSTTTSTTSTTAAGPQHQE